MNIIQMMSRIRYPLIIVLVIIGYAGAFLSGYFLKTYFDNRSIEFPVLNQAYNILLNHAYIDLPELKSLEYGMIRGMLDASGDPYAAFQEPTQHELESNSLQGSFGGIGVELTRTSDGEILVFPISGSPAHEVGLQNSDQLITVNDFNITPETSIDEIKAAIRGPVGTWIEVSIIRDPGDTHLDFRIKRAQIHLPSVTWFITPEEPSIGYIKINIIAESTTREVQNAIEDLQRSGASKYILDLRDNGGGLLTSGVDVAKLFLESGIILQQQYRGQEVEIFSSNSPGPFEDLPLILLVNHNTASAAEIIAGVMQVYHRAVLVGEPTYGKDSIQLIFDLQDNSSLHVTAAKWWIPNLSPSLSDQGLQPDITILPDGSGKDLVLQAAIQSLLEK